MRIKSLQLHGFKSFVDRTVFTFEKGVTAVVGPNGCGKSNVVDAIRWVMGEQSPRRLRGKGMEDVIFIGSESRPPIGMAEVVLTFDNSDGQAPAAFADYAEIQITRRLYRSGESEYLLNRAPARLKDVYDFFRDTGIGVKGYTIVEQGRIAEIVSAKAEERRVLIEEAAGISKYKARRREAESKIASTEQNLVRVSDVLGEVKRQISSLERQARKAARYKRLHETQRVLELSLAADERADLLAASRKAETSLAELRTRLQGLETNTSERDLAVEEKRIVLAEAEKAVTGGAEKLYSLRSDIKGFEGQVELGRRERDGLEESNVGRREELAQLAQQKLVAEREAEQARVELQTLDESLAGEVAAIRDAEAVSAAAAESQRALEREREISNEALVEVLTSIARTEDRLAGLEDRRAQVDQQLRTADRELEVQQTAVVEAGEARTHLEDGLRNLLAERDRFQEHLLRAIKGQEAAGEAVREASQELAEARNRFETRKARQASLREVIEAREDVADGTRHLLGRGAETASRFGLRGMLRDHLEVEPGLELAVEAILAERAEAIVTKSVQGAVEALQAVRDESAGRAVFVVEPPAEPVSSGIVPLGEPLLERVRVHAGFEGVARALLGGVYLVASLPEVMEIYGSGRLPAAFVTRQGDVLSPDGVVHGGGSTQSSSGALARLREVRELDDEVAGLERAWVDADGAHRAAEAALIQATEELDNLRNRHHTAALAVANHEKDLERTNERFKALGDAHEGRVAERSGLLEQTSALVSDREQHAVEIERLRGARTHAQRELDALGLKISAAGREVTRLGSRATELRVAHDARIETRDRLGESAGRAETTRRETAEWIDRREREIVTAVDRIAALVEQVAEAEQSLAIKLESEEEARLSSEQLRERYEGDAQAVRDLDQELRDVRNRVSATRDEMAGADLAVRESELRLRHQHEGVREKWGVDLANWTPPSLDDLAPEPIAPPSGVDSADGVASSAGSDALQAIDAIGEVVEGEAAGEQPGPNDAANALRDLRRNAELARETRPVRERELERIRGGIQSLGDVNLGAIEEHEELAERFRFLSEQKIDLESTIQSLREAISRINRTSRRRFRETFELVSKRFSENFPRLFGGGKASLSLTESEDILEAGIDIMAMPPGKRPQNVNLLSGGEKTMTALALLVAVFQVRPSPFFLLDEVDAALDDANVGRFNQLITELAVDSQFLIITHNKRTIEVADVLYGVTMEQRGVSKLVAVKLQ